MAALSTTKAANSLSTTNAEMSHHQGKRTSSRADLQDREITTTVSGLSPRPEVLAWPGVYPYIQQTESEVLVSSLAPTRRTCCLTGEMSGRKF